MARNSFVGCQHKFFDNRFSYAADPLHDLHWSALFVQNDLLFRQIKVDSAACRTLFAQHQAQLFHHFQHRYYIFVLLRQFFVTVHQYLTHNTVAETVADMNDRREYLVA